MKFSIITPSFNQAEFIEETLQSVLSQENIDLEYWVIDGGSTDGTVDILKKYAKSYQNFRYLSEPDRGQSHAINKGVEKSRGDVVAYLNSDDTYLPGTLEKVSAYVKKNPEINWFYGRSILIDEKGQIIKPTFTWMKNFLGHRYAYWKLMCFNIISQPAVFIKREIFTRHGYFDEQHHLVMDYEYWLRIGEDAPLSMPENLSQFRVHTSSKTSTNLFKIYWSEFKVSLKYLKLIYFPCVVIHFISFITAGIWMRFKKI